MRHDHRARIEAKLTPAELAYLRAYPPHLWRPGAPQLRDYAVREALERVAHGKAPTPAARALAEALRRYQAAGWRHDAHRDVLDDAPQIKAALHRVLRLNDGVALGARRIFDIVRAVDLHDAAMSGISCTRVAR